jgi:hypothetical protein
VLFCARTAVMNSAQDSHDAIIDVKSVIEVLRFFYLGFAAKGFARRPRRWRRF